MHSYHPSTHLLLLAIAALAGVTVADEPTKTHSTTTPVVTPCVATHTSNGAFFDLRPDTAVVAVEGDKPHRGLHTEDYVARGWDYGSNFTLNICDAVVKAPEHVVGVEEALWRNVSAYYAAGGKVYSLGLQSGDLVPRGRKLVLQYKGGSPCGSSEKPKDKRAPVYQRGRYKYHGDQKKEGHKSKRASEDEDKEEKNEKEKEKDNLRRKSATISFLCDHDPDTVTAFSFVGTDPDECAYFFEVRSQHACAGAEPHKKGSVGPGSVFAILSVIAFLVYVVGGVFYQRTVAHARGWRQLPNYSLWAGIWSFVKDLLIILTSSCARIVPRRRGYRTLSVSPSGRGRSREDENRLIDSLDEEWDD